MTPDEIRATAHEAITSALAADHDAKTTGCSGDNDCRQVAELARLAAIAVDALQHVRMLPTGEAWGCRYRGWALAVDAFDDEIQARQHVAARPQDELVRTWTHEWTEMTD